MPLRDDILNPIAGENPCGEDLRYAPVYDQIKEARREDDDVSQGVWQRARKTADWQQVVKLASEAIAKKSKDLQLAAWLTEALVYREGFDGLKDGLVLLRQMLEQHWDNLYPELEDVDSEMRSVPLSYIVTKVELAMRRVPLTAEGISWLEYKDSLTIPTEEEAARDSSKSEKRSDAQNLGKVMPEDVDQALKATPSDHIEQISEVLKAVREDLSALDEICREKFDDYAPNFTPLTECLEQIENTVRIMSQRKGSSAKPAAQKTTASSAPSQSAASSSKSSSWDPFADDDEASEAPAQEEEDSAASSASGYDPFADDEEAAPAAPAATHDPFADDEDEAEAEEEEYSAPAATAKKKSGGTLSAEPDDEEDAVNRICSAAVWLQKQNPRSPAPYVLLRALRFGELKKHGDTPDWSLLEAAPIEVRQRLKLLSMEQNWADLLSACEEAMALPCGRAWLDLQRYTVQALEGLGEEYSIVLAAVREELRGLLVAHPGLPEMTLNDDTPAANPQTMHFLKEEGLLGGAPVKPREVEKPKSDDDIIRDAVKSRKYEIALATVARLLKSESSGRGRFERKVQQANILMEAGRKPVAYPILRELATEIFERRLDEWEPSPLIVEPLILLYQCLDEEGEEGAERQKIYEMVCRLDPVRAFELQ